MTRTTEFRLDGIEIYSDTGLPVNHVWDACVKVLGYEPKTQSERTLWGKMNRSLVGAGATEHEIHAVATYYRKHWPTVDLTITAIEKWYSHFLRLKEAKERAPKPGCAFCGMVGGIHAADCEEVNPHQSAPADGLTFDHEAMSRGIDCVRQWAESETDDQLLARFRQIYSNHVLVGEIEFSRLVGYANVVRMARPRRVQ